MVELQLRARQISDSKVLKAMRAVPRHMFVPLKYKDNAYDDTPLPIGNGQTISQPYVVGLMTELLQVQPEGKYLEIGTGSGYQAAILAAMGASVYTIEILPESGNQASKVINELGYQKVYYRTGDGYYGWSEASPFDGIIVTAAPDHIPNVLLEQLSDQGKLVIPVRNFDSSQTLWLVEKRSGKWRLINHGLVKFVPFIISGGDGGESKSSVIHNT
jgi:protein-L-isoaspartate(D-aspartate) O-methyltransferase